MAKMLCPIDNTHPNGDVDKFCYKCGTRLVEWAQKCTCGRDLSNYDHFCPECGRPVK